MGDDVRWKEVEWLNRVPCCVGLGSNQCYVPFEVLNLIMRSAKFGQPDGT